ncbi:protein FAM156A/FAM156B isoform X5 [Cavia porcellus]|uniref:protein FAM156A/FAM156B isoform X5 n=1 Tax=Cavia porcellus TaxID=10141 RepID=UPI002FE25F5D
MRAPLGDLNPFLTSSASQCFLLWGKEAARLRVDGETCTGERMRPGRIQLICGRPKIIEHLCAKDWTVLTDLLLIWLQHRLLFPWHHRRLSYGPYKITHHSHCPLLRQCLYLQYDAPH